VSIPVKVKGDYFVAPQWLSVYPQKEYGGKFEIPLDPVDTGDGAIEWFATKRQTSSMRTKALLTVISKVVIL